MVLNIYMTDIFDGPSDAVHMHIAVCTCIFTFHAFIVFVVRYPGAEMQPARGGVLTAVFLHLGIQINT